METEKTEAVRQTVLVRPEEGKVLNAFGDSVQVKLSGDETNGTLAIGLGSTPAGHGPPPHVHRREDELFIILKGNYRFLSDTGWSEPLGPGGLAYTPRGVRHTFQCIGPEDGQHWVIATPSGFERFFAECAEVFAQGGVPDMERLLAIARQHELEFIPPLVPM